MTSPPDNDAPPPLPPDLKGAPSTSPWDNPPAPAPRPPSPLAPSAQQRMGGASSATHTTSPQPQRRHLAFIGTIIAVNLMVGMGVVMFLLVSDDPSSHNLQVPSTTDTVTLPSAPAADTPSEASEPTRMAPPAHLDVPDHPAELGKFVHWLQASDHVAERGKGPSQ